MLKGYTVPRSPLGHAAIDPPPPRHYSGPVEVGRGYRFGMAYSATTLEVLRDFAA